MEELPEHLVHELLEDGWKGHTASQGTHRAGGSNECHLPLIAFPDSNEVVRAMQIQLREDAGPMEFLKCGRDKGKWIGELDSLGV